MDHYRQRFVKIVVFGLMEVGKSCLIRAYTQGKYTGVREITTFADVSCKTEEATVTDENGTYVAKVKTEVWDTQGDLASDRLSFLRQGTSAILLSFDLGYEFLMKCKRDQEKFVEILEMFTQTMDKLPFVLLVGTKSDKIYDIDLADFEYDEDIAKRHLNYAFPDLEETSRSEDGVEEETYINLLNVALYRMKEVLSHYNIPLEFIATSSKHFENVDDCFRIVIRKVIDSKLDIEKNARSAKATNHAIHAAKVHHYLPDKPTIKLHNPKSTKDPLNGESETSCCN